MLLPIFCDERLHKKIVKFLSLPPTKHLHPSKSSFFTLKNEKKKAISIASLKGFH